MPYSRVVLAIILAVGFIVAGGRWAVAALPGEHLLQERQLCEAQDLLHETVTALEALGKEFSERPEKLDDPAWVQSALTHMALADEMARDALYASLEHSWEPEVFNTYVRFFINPHPEGEADLGYLQRLDREHYALLKRILTESEALGARGWPTPSAFDTLASYQAFVLARRGYPTDRDWQESTLIPRLKRLAETGEIPAAALAWLTANSPEDLAVAVEGLGAAGAPWSKLVEHAEHTSQLLSALRKTADADILPPLTHERCGPEAIMVEAPPDAANATRAENATRQ